MITKIFDIEKNKIVLNHHVMAIEPLYNLYQKNNGVKYLLYCYYLTNPYPDENPFALIPHHEKETKIKRYLNIQIKDDVLPLVKEAINFFNSIYETPIIRFHTSIKNKIDDISQYLQNTKVNDKNIRDILNTIKAYRDIIDPYKLTLKEVMEERDAKIKANINRPYDQ